MKIYSKPLKAIFAILPFTLLLTGCGRDFPSVQKFQSIKIQLQEASDSMADDIYNSCITRIKYRSFIANPDFQVREEDDKKCNEENKPTSLAVKDANNLLVDYINALVQLGNGNTVSFDKNFQNLGESLKNLKLGGANGKSFTFPKADIDAGISLAKFLTNAITKEFRRENLKKAILCTNKDIQTYIGESSTLEPDEKGLIALTEEGYIQGVLKVEEEQIQTYYTDYLVQLRAIPNSLPMAYRELDKDYDTAITSVRNRREAAENYVEILKTIAKMHTKLKTEFQGKNNLTGVQLQNYCQDIYQPQTQKTAKPEKAVEYNPEQLARIEKIAVDYTQRLDELIPKNNKNK